MRKVVLVGLIALVAMAGNCCPPVNCQRDCPVPPPTTKGTVSDDGKVDIVILPLPEDTTATCVVVEGERYCAPGSMKKSFPTDSLFTIDVDDEVYELDAYSLNRAPLETVYVVIGSKYIVGVYADEQYGVAAEVGKCVTCPNGATVCGYNPRCPR